MLDAHITQIMRSVYVKPITLSQKLCALLETLSLLTERRHPCCLKLSQWPRPPAVQTFHLRGAANQKTSSIKGTVALKGGRELQIQREKYWSCSHWVWEQRGKPGKWRSLIQRNQGGANAHRGGSKTEDKKTDFQIKTGNKQNTRGRKSDRR